MRISSVPLFVSLALSVGACADASVAPTSGANAASTETTRPLGRSTSDAANFDTHSFWFDTGREVVVFDAQFTPAAAKGVIDDIQSKTKSPIRWVVVTHPNPDKFNGASAFQAIGAKVIASESTARAIPAVHTYKKGYFVNVAKAFTNETYPSLPTIDVTFTKDHDLPLEGGAKVHLHELAHGGVTSTQTVAFVPAVQALIVGDLVHHEAHAWLEGAIVDGSPKPDLASWKAALDELAAYRGATVYGGRGGSANVTTAIADQKAYLDTIAGVIERYVADLGPAKAELAGPKAPAHYKQIAVAAAREFPSYALPYMIEYGAYGLVNQIAAR